MAKRTSIPVVQSMPSGGGQDCEKTVSIRKIDNGYIRRESSYGPNGYTSSEKFSPSHPGLDASPPVEGQKNSLRDAIQSLKGRK